MIQPKTPNNRDFVGVRSIESNDSNPPHTAALPDLEDLIS